MPVDTRLYQRILETCFPELAVSRIRFLGGGSCRVFIVNESLIFRFPHGDGGAIPEDGAFLHHEKRVYDTIAPLLPLPIPCYRYFSAGCALFPYPVAGYALLPGRSLSACALPRQEALRAAAQIGAFLSALHGISLAALPAALQPPSPTRMGRAAARSLFHDVQALAFPLLDAAEQAWTTELFQKSDDAYGQEDIAPVFTHGDFDGSNILYDAAAGAVSGIIDFEEAGQKGDPAIDFCALLGGFGKDFLAAALGAYTHHVSAVMRRRIDLLAKRILFIELLYGIQVDDPRFINNARRRLHRARRDADPIGDWLDVSTSETR